ncbi:hypothetical protein Ccrd_014474 [Cynara cardunculus var. scolymus]|uniref:C2 NT-type domain-containing protein n=1 Tax=Cynara cardunculus var. scolymus TaxID=59895 RepID=A0A118K485_CYNCS|nr:hypothetical protein Ccrd_014474 [Cynara cardunculus var. scolymus]
MFKSGRWKTQNSKKVMFQMQFQATQVPKLKGKGLMISLIPADIGKPTARLEKTAIVEGTCTWESPIYEMVKLVKHQKTETYKEKIYYFNVATGSSKAGFVGEVFIQKMQRTDEQRESEENESLQAESFRSKNQASDGSENENILDFAEDDYISRVNSQNNRDPRLENNPKFQEHTAVRRNPNPVNKKGDALRAENHVQQRSSTDWSLGSLSDRSMADLLNSPEHNYQDQTNGYAEASKNAVEVLKSDVTRLERQAELSELELESLRKQMLKENKRGQDLSRKIAELKEEKEYLKTECDQLKSSHKHMYKAVPRLSESPEVLKVLLDEVREELKREKDLNKSLSLHLEETEESNSKLFLAVKDLDRMVEEKNSEMSDLSEKLKESQMAKEAIACKRDHEKEKIEGLYAEIELQKKEKEELKIHIEDISVDYKLLLQENDDISCKLEQTQIEQMEMQSEYSNSLATIKQYELQVKRIEEKIMNQTSELSQSLDMITELETHVKGLEKELDKQGHDFEDDVQDLMKAKIEQEQRVVEAEEALRKTRLANAIAAENLQEELRRLSVEMTSKLDEKEKLASEAIAEAQNLQLQMRDLQEALEKSRQEFSLTKDIQEANNCDFIRDAEAETPREWIRERELLVTELASLKKETEKLQKESTTWTSLMSEKNVMIRSMQSELKMLRGDHNELRQRLLVIELEKSNLQKEVSRLEHNLRKKEEATTTMDQPKHLNLLKESNVPCDVSITTNKHDVSRSTLESAKSNERRRCSQKEQSVPTSHYNDEQNLNRLLSEISTLDERNKHMESELKEMQEKYLEISLRFAEVEGERQQLVMTLRNLRNGKKK